MMINVGVATEQFAVGSMAESVGGSKDEKALGLVVLSKGGENDQVGGSKTVMVGGAVVDKAAPRRQRRERPRLSRRRPRPPPAKPRLPLEEYLPDASAWLEAAPARAERAASAVAVGIRTPQVTSISGRRVTLTLRGSQAPVEGEIAPEVDADVVADACENGDAVLVEVGEGDAPVVGGGAADAAATGEPAARRDGGARGRAGDPPALPRLAGSSGLWAGCSG